MIASPLYVRKAGFTGTDANKHHWVNGKQVAAPEDAAAPKPSAPAQQPPQQAAAPDAKTQGYVDQLTAKFGDKAAFKVAEMADKLRQTPGSEARLAALKKVADALNPRQTKKDVKTAQAGYNEAKQQLEDQKTTTDAGRKRLDEWGQKQSDEITANRDAKIAQIKKEHEERMAALKAKQEARKGGGESKPIPTPLKPASKDAPKAEAKPQGFEDGVMKSPYGPGTIELDANPGIRKLAKMANANIVGVRGLIDKHGAIVWPGDDALHKDVRDHLKRPDAAGFVMEKKGENEYKVRFYSGEDRGMIKAKDYMNSRLFRDANPQLDGSYGLTITIKSLAAARTAKSLARSPLYRVTAFDESKVNRAEDGRFGDKPGEHSAKADAPAAAKPQGKLSKIWGQVVAKFKPGAASEDRHVTLDTVTPQSRAQHVGTIKAQLETLGVKDFARENLHRAPTLRQHAITKPDLFDKHIEAVEIGLAQALHFGGDPILSDKLKEIERLKKDVNEFRAKHQPEVAPLSVDLQALPDHFKRKGAAQENTRAAAEHLAKGGDAKSAVAHVMKHGGIAEATAKRYVRAALKAAEAAADANILKLSTAVSMKRVKRKSLLSPFKELDHPRTADGKFGSGGGSKSGWIDNPIRPGTSTSFGGYADGTRTKIHSNGEAIEGEIGGLPVTTETRQLLAKVSKKTRQAMEAAFSDPDTRKAIDDAGIHTVHLADGAAKFRPSGWTMAHSNGVLMINQQTAERIAKRDKIRGKDRGITGVIHHEAGHGLWAKASQESRSEFVDAIRKHPEVMEQIAKEQKIDPPHDRMNDSASDKEQYRIGEVHAELNAIRKYDPARFNALPASVRNAVESIGSVKTAKPAIPDHLRNLQPKWESHGD